MNRENIRKLEENIFESTNAEIKTTLNDIVDDELDEQLLGYLNDLIEEKFYRPLWKARAQPKERNYE